MNPVPFEELVQGSSLESHGRTISETDLSISCMVTGDWHPIHADEHFAKSTPIGQRILHGPYGVLLSMGMSTELPVFADAVIGATGIKEWQYRRPLIVGDTIRVKATIASKRVTSDGKRAVIERHIALINHKDETIQEGTVGTMVRLGSREHTK